jgi:hypothetical protein
LLHFDGVKGQRLKKEIDAGCDLLASNRFALFTNPFSFAMEQAPLEVACIIGS